MIATLRGTLVVKDAQTVVVECAGVGREVHVTAATSARLPPVGGEAFLHVLPSYAMYGGGETLYGFIDASEKSMFAAFRDEIPGTGAKKALEYLDKASKSLPDFRRAVLENDEALMCGVFGFTRKTATKIIGALKDKLDGIPTGGSARLERTIDLPGADWAIAQSALEALGYRPNQARTALQTLVQETRGEKIPAEHIVRRALKLL